MTRQVNDDKCRVGKRLTHLNSHNFISFLKNHFVDTAESTASDFTEINQVVGREVVNFSTAELQLS